MQNISLHYNGSLKKVRSAVNAANEILGSEEFYKAIMNYKHFDNSTLSPNIIADLIATSGQKIEVTVNWFIPIVKMGYDKIGLSGWDFSDKLGEGVNKLIYETIYCVDCLNEFNKGNKNIESGTHTAPILIASLAEGIVLGNMKQQTAVQL